MLHISMLFWTLLIVRLGLGVAANVQSERSYVPIIKPGEREPSCAEGKNYCETVPKHEYPEKEILKILVGLQHLPSEFISFIFDDNSDEINIEYVDETNYEFNLRLNTSRFGWKMSYDQLCRSSRNFIRPVAVRTEHNGWRYIVNDITIKKADFPQLTRPKATYEQAVEIQTCQPVTGSQMCSQTISHETQADTTVHARCEQVYRTIKLLALDPSGTHLYTEYFSSPSCCQCSIY